MSTPTCSLCEKPAFLKINGNRGYRCQVCYSRGIEKKVKQTISKYQMISRGQRVAIGFSGGKDSTVLVNILAKIFPQSSQTPLIILTIDEGITGYREESQELVKRQIDLLKLEYHSISFKTLYGYTLDELVKKNPTTLSPCALCGPLRRNALNHLAREVHADILATGHTLDDEAQTVVMNFLRGDYQRLLRITRTPKFIHSDFIPRVKPLVRLSERDIVYYLFANHLAFQDVSCGYAAGARRNSIRRFLFDEENAHQGTLNAVINTHDALVADLSSGNIAKESPLQECRRCGEPAEDELCSVCKVLEKILH